MAVFHIFSKRQSRGGQDDEDVLRYDDLPQTLRVQIKFIWDEAFRGDLSMLFARVVPILRREYGIFTLAWPEPNALYRQKYDYVQEGVAFFGTTDNVNRALDMIELTFQFIYQNFQDQGKSFIEELNRRFLEHKVGYQFEAGKIVRLDSTYVHNEAVKPAFTILSDPMYEGAQSEFLKAHEHFRHGRVEEALADALKSFESTMKAICDKHKWKYKEVDTDCLHRTLE
jgi:hypothetical protein